MHCQVIIVLAYQASTSLPTQSGDFESNKDVEVNDVAMEPQPLKRPERPVTEKVSPEKKLLKTSPNPAPPPSVGDIAPKALAFESDGDSEKPAPPPGLCHPTVPQPAPVPPASSLDQATVTALLKRIADLEAQVKSKPEPTAPPAATPPVKTKPVRSPASVSTDSTAEASSSKEAPEIDDKGSEDDGQEGSGEGEMLVMPSGNAVTWCHLAVSHNKTLHTWYDYAVPKLIYTIVIEHSCTSLKPCAADRN